MSDDAKKETAASADASIVTTWIRHIADCQSIDDDQVETTASADASTVARMGRLVEAAAAQRSPLEGAVARFAKYYTPAVLLAALCIAFLPWAAGRDNHKACMPVEAIVQICYSLSYPDLCKLCTMFLHHEVCNHLSQQLDQIRITGGLNSSQKAVAQG